MAAGVPPPPLNSPSGSYYWLEWYTNLTNFLNGTNIPWSNLNFTGSNLTDIQNRSHQDLQELQGGTPAFRYHTAGYAFIDHTGTLGHLPSTWTVTHPSAGVYVITHNLNLTAPNYMAGATSNSVGFVVQCVALTTANTVTVTCTNPGGTLSDTDFTVWVGQI